MPGYRLRGPRLIRTELRGRRPLQALSMIVRLEKLPISANRCLRGRRGGRQSVPMSSFLAEFAGYPVMELRDSISVQ